ncbi:MAG: molybdopterin-dependent oxidoreductase, partial [Deltaproteobacteria bacterium]|nr:molybdopterin-dependent oxidoreductase [Deltaproteobacteria bacterium]
MALLRQSLRQGTGAKAGTSPLELCAPILRKITGRPVKMVYSREEMMMFGRGRHKQYMKYKLGVDRTGRIKAFESE